MRALFVACLVSMSVPAFAQSSLGITGAAFSLGTVEDELGGTRVEGAATLDVAITTMHGFQGDLWFVDTVGGGVGSVGAHLYMAPQSGQKYGLFVQLSDVDGRAMTWGAIGAEGMISLSDATTLEVQGGLGAADEGGLDFIFGSVGLSHAYSDAFEVSATLDLADFDEASFRATSYEAGLTARYSPDGAPWGVYAGLSHSGFEGRDGVPGETRIGLGLTVEFGNVGGIDPSTRYFRSANPVTPLLRSGLW